MPLNSRPASLLGSCPLLLVRTLLLVWLAVFTLTRLVLFVASMRDWLGHAGIAPALAVFARGNSRETEAGRDDPLIQRLIAYYQSASTAYQEHLLAWQPATTTSVQLLAHQSGNHEFSNDESDNDSGKNHAL